MISQFIPGIPEHSRQRLMAATDDLLLPRQIDLALLHELLADLKAHAQADGALHLEQGIIQGKW